MIFVNICKNKPDMRPKGFNYLISRGTNLKQPTMKYNKTNIFLRFLIKTSMH